MSRFFLDFLNLTDISKRYNNIATSYVSIYSILYRDCDKYQIGETKRNLEKKGFTNTNEQLN